MKRRAVIGRIALLSLGTTLDGCSFFKKPPPPPPPTKIELTIIGGATLNPTQARRPSPVVVRIFDLKSAAGFEAADYNGLFDKDREALGADLVAREEFVLKPGEARRIDRPLAPETQVIGIAAAFRDLERSTWRATIAVKPNTPNRTVASLDGVTITALPAP